TLAERARADDDCALMVLQCAGNDLRRRGRAAIDQHDDRLALGEIAGPRNEAMCLLGLAAARRNDLTCFQEGVRYRDRLVEQAAWIVAQIDNIAFQVFGADLRRELVEGLLDLV